MPGLRFDPAAAHPVFDFAQEVRTDTPGHRFDSAAPHTASDFAQEVRTDMPGLRFVPHRGFDLAHQVLQFMPVERKPHICRRNLKEQSRDTKYQFLDGRISHLGSANGSIDSEHDLAAMVHDFLENGSCGTECYDSSDSDHGASNVAKLFETLQTLRLPSTPTERDLSAALPLLLFSMKEIDLNCLSVGNECKGGCINRVLVKNLRLAGYDAAGCKSKWQSSGKVPGGEYEYIDVKLEGKVTAAKRLIIDLDFRSQFEIARPTHAYSSALQSLPLIFVGSLEKLEKIVQAMADFAKLSLKQNAMPLPPWRTFEYMSAKWLSSYERECNYNQAAAWRGPCGLQSKEFTRNKQCAEQLRHLKMCISAESENHGINVPSCEKVRGIVRKDYRRPLAWIAQQST